jgi:hypothetical protein
VKNGLFPELPFTKGSYGTKVSDWFKTYKRSYGINPPPKAPLMDFHSLRKNFIKGVVAFVSRDSCLKKMLIFASIKYRI